MAEIYHANFHTFQNRPVFLVPEFEATISNILMDIGRRHGIVCLARALMPTHVHVVVVAFPDLPRDRAIQLLKGASAREFFQQFPEIGSELGGHLWQQGYQWVLITSNRQLRAAITYVRSNRPKIGLPPEPDTVPGL